MASFDLTEEQNIMKGEVHNLAQTLMRDGDHHRHYEKAGEVTGALLDTYNEMQLALVDIPEALGGVGMGALGAAIVQEELGWGDAGAALALPGPGLVTSLMLALGSEAQQKKTLKPFVDNPNRRGAVAFIEPNSASDPAEFKTTFEKKGKGYILNGKKGFVLNGGIADTTIVFAAPAGEAPGWHNLRAFVVEKASGGLKAGERKKTLGLRAAHFADITLDKLEVPEEAMLEGDLMKRVDMMIALSTAAYNGRNVGMTRAAAELAKEYTMSRVAFGKPIAQHQGMSWYLVDMMIQTDAARMATWQSAYLADTGEPEGGLSLRSIRVTDEFVLKACDRCIQALGGSGFIQDFPAEKWSRDARTHTLIGGFCPSTATGAGAMLMQTTRSL